MAKKIIGIILIVAGIYFLFRPLSFSDSRTQATGTVLAVNTTNTFSVTEQKNLRKTDVTVSYQTQSGQSVQFDTTAISPFASYHAGQKVTVLYEPQYPDQAGLKDEYTKWYIPLLLWVLGIGTLFASQISNLKTAISGNTNNQSAGV